MAGKNTSVFGIFHDRCGVEEATDTLRAAGFRSTDISVLFQENPGTKDMAHEKKTKAPEGAAVGAIVGGIAGAVLGWLIAAGFLTVPGSATLVETGTLLATLAGVGALGTLGLLVGASAGAAVPEYEARRFAGRIKQAGPLLSVHCDNGDWAKRAKDLLRQTGGESIGSAGESAADFSVSDKPLPRLRRPVMGEPSPGQNASTEMPCEDPAHKV